MCPDFLCILHFMFPMVFSLRVRLSNFMYWIDTPGYLDVRISVFLLQFFIIDILFRPLQCLSSGLGGIAETGAGLRQVHNIKECVGGGGGGA